MVGEGKRVEDEGKEAGRSQIVEGRGLSSLVGERGAFKTIPTPTPVSQPRHCDIWGWMIHLWGLPCAF